MEISWPAHKENVGSFFNIYRHHIGTDNWAIGPTETDGQFQCSRRN